MTPLQDSRQLSLTSKGGDGETLNVVTYSKKTGRMIMSLLVKVGFIV